MQWHGRKPLLYLTYFRNGDTKYAEEAAIYLPTNRDPSGFLRTQRVLWNYATQGGGQYILPDMPEYGQMAKLANMKPLPLGFSSSGETSTARLLIVSQRSGGKWLTRYYDRRHLPQEMEQIFNVVHDSRTSHPEMMGQVQEVWPPPVPEG